MENKRRVSTNIEDRRVTNTQKRFGYTSADLQPARKGPRVRGTPVAERFQQMEKQWMSNRTRMPYQKRRYVTP